MDALLLLNRCRRQLALDTHFIAERWRTRNALLPSRIPNKLTFQTSRCGSDLYFWKVDFCLSYFIEVIRENVQRDVGDDFTDLTLGKAGILHRLHIRL